MAAFASLIQLRNVMRNLKFSNKMDIDGNIK